MGFRREDVAGVRSPASSERPHGPPRLDWNKLQSPRRQKNNNPNVGGKGKSERKKGLRSPRAAAVRPGLDLRYFQQENVRNTGGTRGKQRRAALRIPAPQFRPRPLPLTDWLTELHGGECQRNCRDGSREGNSGISTPQIQTLPRRLCAQPAATDRYEGLEQTDTGAPSVRSWRMRATAPRTQNPGV